MPDFIALDWEKNQLCGIDADVGKGTVRARQCFTLVWPEGLDPAEEPEAVGDWLKEQLKKLRVSSKQVLVAVPREDATVRHLELPQTPDSELPDLVRFQASTKSALPIAQLCLDYIPLPPREGFAGRDVLMTTISKSMLDSIQTVLAAADLELVSLSVASIAAAELVARVAKDDSPDQTNADLVIGRHEDRVEISVVRNKHMLFTHSAQLGGETDQDQQILSILAEVSRSFVALQKILTDIKIGRAWVLGHADETHSLVDKLRKRLEIATIATDACSVAAIDPLTISDLRLKASDQVGGNRALYAGPVGMLLSKSGATVEAIDFLNPRKPEVKPDNRKYQAALIAAIAALFLVSAYGLAQMSLSSFDEEIAKDRSKNADDESELKGMQPTLEAAAKVEGWLQNRVNWLDETAELTATMQTTEQHYLRKLMLSQSNQPTPEFLGKISGNGVSKSHTDVNLLNNRIERRGRWSSGSHEIPKDSPDTAYPFRFELDVKLSAEAETKPDGKEDKSNGNRTTSGRKTGARS